MTCPLCATTNAALVENIIYEKIWSALASCYGANFDPSVIARHTPAHMLSLLECRTCGLHYFSPAIPGDGDFYSQLTTSAVSYYSDDKWDFRVALNQISPGDSLLDIACGGGAWLQLAKAQGAIVCGIDTNSAAVATACQGGLSVSCASLEGFANDNCDRFDTVTAFQVIEHVSDICSFVTAAKTCLKPGGKLILTVPNRFRRFRLPFEPLDCPPHHLSRWTAKQFPVLATLCGLDLLSIRYEPAQMSDCRSLFRSWIAPEGKSEALWARGMARLAFSPSLYALYNHVGLMDYWQLWGMSLLAVLKK